MYFLRRGDVLTARRVARSWWVVSLSGLLLFGWGLVALFSGLAAMTVLAVALGGILVASGVALAATALWNRDQIDNWGWALLVGIIDLALGIVLLANPVATAAALPLAVGIWAILRGLFESADALRLKRLGYSRWGAWLAAGLVSIVFGGLVLAAPLAGFVAVTLLLGLSAIVIGGQAIAAGLQLREMGESRVPVPAAERPEERHDRAA